MTAPKRKPKPITAHPMFPMVTALWCAMALGLGSFMLAPMLLEKPVVALGIPALIPAAAPPLGFTARALLALVMVAIGAAAGFLGGRRIAEGKVEAPVRARTVGRAAQTASAKSYDAEDTFGVATAAGLSAQALADEQPRLPINAADLGEPLDAPLARAPFRPDQRAFSIADDVLPFEQADRARLPWEDDGASGDTAHNSDAFAAAPFAHPDNAADQNAEVDAFVASLQPLNASDQSDAAEPEDHRFVPAAEPVELELEEVAEQPDLQAEEMPEPVAEAERVSLLQAHAAAAVPLARMPVEGLGLVQLVERLALALHERTQAARSAPPQSFSVQPDPLAAPQDDPVPTPAPPAAAFAAPIVEPTAAEPAQTPMPRLGIVSADADTGDTASFMRPEASETVVQLRPFALQPVVPVAEPSDGEDDADISLSRFLQMPAESDGQSVDVFAAPETDNAAHSAATTDWDDVAEGRGDTETQDIAEDASDAYGDDEDDEYLDEEDVLPVLDIADRAEPEVAEERYPSLLEMAPSTPRHNPLRFDLDADNEPGMEGETDATADFVGQLGVPEVPQPHGSARPFERPGILPVPGSPLASPGRAAPSPQSEEPAFASPASLPVHAATTSPVDPEEADRALRAALATLQRMTAQG